MAVHPVRFFGDPVLREKSLIVEKIDKEIAVLTRNMAETMTDAAGVGLAAPQIGVLKQVIVVQMEDDGYAVYINPVIVESSSDEETEEEGCLCLPDIRIPVSRAKRVVVEALDLKGRKVEVEADEMLARIFQHEVDHLEGRTILDRTDPKLRQQAIGEFMENMEKRAGF